MRGGSTMLSISTIYYVYMGVGENLWGEHPIAMTTVRRSVGM